MVVVHHNLTANHVKELKDKKACFPEFAGLGKGHLSLCRCVAFHLLLILFKFQVVQIIR